MRIRLRRRSQALLGGAGVAYILLLWRYRGALVCTAVAFPPPFCRSSLLRVECCLDH
jgi:hypothetical protein